MKETVFLNLCRLLISVAMLVAADTSIANVNFEAIPGQTLNEIEVDESIVFRLRGQEVLSSVGSSKDRVKKDQSLTTKHIPVSAYLKLVETETNTKTNETQATRSDLSGIYQTPLDFSARLSQAPPVI